MMHKTASPKTHNSEVPLWTFGIFGIIFFMAVIVTWWFTRSYYQENKPNALVISKLDSSLISCNNLIQNMNSAILNEMDEKLKDPARREKALLWNPRAKSALNFTQSIQQYMQELKSEITGASAKKRFGSKKAFYKPDISEGLYDSLNNFNYYLTDLIPHDRINQLGVLPVQVLISGEQIKSKDEWYELNFKNLDTTATLAMLSKIETDILRSTNVVLDYMNNQNERLIHNCESYLPLMSQNAMVFLPGQVLEITTGIGVYSSLTKPTIKINNNYVPINESGYSVYKQTIGNEKEGSVLVTISYKDPNTGQPRSISKSVVYTVFQAPKN